MAILSIQEYPFPKNEQTIQQLLVDHASNDTSYGRQIQDPSVLQLTSISSSSTASDQQRPPTTTNESLGRAVNTITIPLLNSDFLSSLTTKVPVTEYVLNYFPLASLTPEFTSAIESDFHAFDELFKPEADCLGGATGWSDILTHPKLGQVKAFAVIRGWQSMRHFEESVQTQGFKQGIPLLYAWKAPFRMWHVERLNRGEVV